MKVVIFGNRKFASLAWYTLTHDSDHEVVAFTVDAPYLTENTLHDLPVVDFDKLGEIYPPEDYAIYAHVGGLDMNRVRTRVFNEARKRGYRFITYISSRAIIWPDLKMGDHCAIYEGAIIQPFSTLGDNVIVRSGAHLSHHTTVEDHCFLAAGICLGGGVTIGAGSFIGLNATIRDRVTIAPGCMIAAGATVLKDTEPNGVYAGVPARRIKDA